MDPAKKKAKGGQKKKVEPNYSQRPVASNAQRRSPLPSQYIYTPTPTPPPQPVSGGGIHQIPPPQTSTNHVRNYPPPQVLFQNSGNIQGTEEQPNLSSTSCQNNPQAPGTSNPNSHARRTSNLNSHALGTSNLNPHSPVTSNLNSHAPGTSNLNSPVPGTPNINSPAQSHPSSQGNNFHPEPDLDDDTVQSLNDLLRVPGRERWTTVLHPDHLPNTEWFDENPKLVRRVSKVLQNKFNAAYYSWSRVPRDKRGRLFTEFAKTHHWDPLITGTVQEEFEKVCKRRLKGLVSNVRTKRKKPLWIEGDLWNVMDEEWATPEAKGRSQLYSCNRNSDRDGLGPHNHLSGPKSYLQIQKDLEKKLGRKVTIGEVFIKTHTRPDGTFVDKKAERIAKTYEKNIEEKLTELEQDPASLSDGASAPPELTADDYTDIFLQSTEKDTRGNLYGLGSLKNTLRSSRCQADQPSSFGFVEEQLKEAHRKIEEQAALNAEIAAREEQNARLVAEQKEKLAELSFVEKYLRLTDPRFREFMETQSANGTVPLNTTHPATDPSVTQLP